MVTAADLRDAGEYTLDKHGRKDFGKPHDPWPPGKKLQCSRIEDDYSVTDVFVPLESGESQATVRAQMPYLIRPCLRCPLTGGGE